MKNKEHFKEQIFEMTCNGKKIAVDKNGKLCECTASTHCEDCKLFRGGVTCRDVFKEWCNEEYAPFEKNELVEVSDDGDVWYLRYFSHVECGVFITYVDGLKSTDTPLTVQWKYCKKYGTLGGLVKEQNNV